MKAAVFRGVGLPLDIVDCPEPKPGNTELWSRAPWSPMSWRWRAARCFRKAAHAGSPVQGHDRPVAGRGL